MNPSTCNSVFFEITFEYNRIDTPLIGALTSGVLTKTASRFAELGIRNHENNVIPQLVSVAEITSFSPEPYSLKCPPLRIEIVSQGCEVVASHHESNIHASGDTPYEAIENLKSVMLDIFDSLTAEPIQSLGQKAKCQRALLESLIERQ
jgi:hypothetical protein